MSPEPRSTSPSTASSSPTGLDSSSLLEVCSRLVLPKRPDRGSTSPFEEACRAFRITWDPSRPTLEVPSEDIRWV